MGISEQSIYVYVIMLGKSCPNVLISQRCHSNGIFIGVRPNYCKRKCTDSGVALWFKE